MALPYRCLILDHEDTALDLEGWFLKNFDPGVGAYLREELAIWREHTLRVTPAFYPGFIQALRAFRDRGGIITVVSHSEAEVVRRHYAEATAGSPLLPDLVFGWEQEERERKPSPWPAEQILRAFDLRPGQALIVDDLKAGVLMGRRAGIPVAAAGWGHRIAAIEAYMREHCEAYFATVEHFARHVLGAEAAPYFLPE